MSYCRFSSDNWKCDLYMWHDISGVAVIQVAANRVEGDVPVVQNDLIARGNYHEWTRQHEAQMKWLQTAPRTPISLPYAGERIECDSPATLMAMLVKLSALGYRFPDSALASVAEEIESGVSFK